LSERFIALPTVSASTKDGSEISIAVSISYRVYDPALIIHIATPLKNLFSMCEAAIRNFIVTHRHDELIGEPGSGEFIHDREIIQFIKEQVAMNQACRAFWVMDVIIKERFGNPEISRIKHVDLVQEKKNLTERKNVIQQQEIAEEQKRLAATKADQDRIVKETQALAEANRSEILKHARVLEIELDGMRKTIDTEQEQVLRMIDVKRQALETLLHLSKISGFPRDANDLKLMEKILGSLSEQQLDRPEIPPERSKSVNELSSTIINLIVPKDKEK
jgi:regulator of protease activity HflC (stomatin/prohibitin superfamily)